MQSRDGGWGAFDADNTRAPDREAAVLRLRRGHRPAVGRRHRARRRDARAQRAWRDTEPARRGVRWLLDAQEPDGSWFGRWGANYVYGTGAVVPALVAAGVGADVDPRCGAPCAGSSSTRTPTAAGARTCAPTPTTRGAAAARRPPSQTAWALLALLAADPDTAGGRPRRATGWSRRSAPTAAGTKTSSPAPASPATSTSTTSCTALVFPLSALGRYLRVHEEVDDRRVSGLLVVTALRSEYAALAEQVPGATLDALRHGPRAGSAHGCRDWRSLQPERGRRRRRRRRPRPVAAPRRRRRRERGARRARPDRAARRGAAGRRAAPDGPAGAHRPDRQHRPHRARRARARDGSPRPARWPSTWSRPRSCARCTSSGVPIAVVRVIVDTAHTPLHRLATITGRRAGAAGAAPHRPGAAALGRSRRPAARCCWPRRARSAPASSARSTSSSWRCGATRARSTSAARSCTTRTSSPTCSARARCSSTNSTRCPTAPRWCSPRTASPRPSATEAARRGLNVIDATCPLVAKVHTEARRFVGRGDTVLFDRPRRARRDRGHARRGARADHCWSRTPPRPSGSSADDPEQGRRSLMQTTLAVDEAAEIVDVLRRRFPLDRVAGDRRHLLRDHQPPAGGARDRRRVRRGDRGRLGELVELAAPGRGRRALRRAGPSRRRRHRASCPNGLHGASTVGITAGASAPPHLVDEVIGTLACARARSMSIERDVDPGRRSGSPCRRRLLTDGRSHAPRRCASAAYLSRRRSSRGARSSR